MSGHDSKFDVKESSSGKKFDHHGECIDDPSLKGITRYFNSSTVRGRANVAKATICGIAAYIVFRKFKKSSIDDKATNKLDSVIITETA